jgi:hypothetical protein
MKKCLIYERLEAASSLKATEAGGLMKLQGVFGVCGVRNNNNRVYKLDNYRMMVEQVQRRIAEGGCPGELEHPDSMNINLENISHKIDSISIDENGVVSGEITLLDTPKGKIAQALVRGGLPLFISSRARGTIDNSGNVTLEELKTYDLVGTPGFSQAKMNLKEGQKAAMCTESMLVIECAEEKQEDESNCIEMDNIQIEDLRTELQELSEAVRRMPAQICDAVQKWVTEDYSKVVQKWVTEEAIPETGTGAIDARNICDAVQKWITEEYSPKVQQWITEEYSPKLQEWITEEYSPMVQEWITEEYSPMVQGWITEEYSPMVQGWITEEYSPKLQQWITEEYSPMVQNWITEEYSGELQRFLEQAGVLQDKKSVLAEIDEALKALQAEPAKKTYQSRAQAESVFERSMDDATRIKWAAASDAKRAEIMQKSRLFDLRSNAGQEKFWEAVNWTEQAQQTVVTETLHDDWKSRMVNLLKKK